MLLRTAGKRPRGDGFNLVVLVMAITVLNVLLAMALPAWSTFIQRQKEEELIFRGLQYAEAVRVFQLRQSRFPTQLRELVEVYPRSIRQLWRNPVAEDGAWLLLPALGGGRQLNRQQDQNGRQQPNRGGRPGAGAAPTAVRVVPPRPGELQFTPQSSVPFMGVASPEGDEAIKSFMGSTEISEWRFTAELVNALQHDPTHNFARPVNSGLFWKPFPPGITPPQAGGQVQPMDNPLNRRQQQRRPRPQ